MGRRKKLDSGNPQRVREILIKYGVDPFEEMVRLAKGRVPIPVVVDEEILKPMMDRYDIVTDESGKRWLELRIDKKIDTWDKCCRYVYPVLKSSEMKESKDYSLKVTIRKFGDGDAPVVIDMPVEVKAIEDKGEDNADH